MLTDADLYLRFDGYEDLKPLLDGSDEDVLVALGKPALIRIPGTDAAPQARLVACLLHGNEDSGYRAVLEVLRAGERYPFDLWVVIGNVRAASQEGWFAHRFLDGQEDFNRVWGLHAPTTTTRRCADALLDVLLDACLDAAVDIHNNTGVNPYYTIVPDPTQESLALAASLADTVLRWPLRAYTLMEALSGHCPAVSVECGLPGLPENHAFASSMLRRFLSMAEVGSSTPEQPALPQRVFEMMHRVVVRPEVPFAFGGTLTEELDLVLTIGTDGHNFGMLLAGSEIGRVHATAAMPLVATDMRERDTTERFFTVSADGSLRVVEDITPAMFTTTVLQTRRDCLFYVARRRL
ncbi:MAG: succinylglutamate desuccinylase/aspartoacylase family protein [Actinomycetota bacterium]|nr:succinylglutamate desuccinylase/aspartoacylase family protein [Actinomycetota bacterium]